MSQLQVVEQRFRGECFGLHVSMQVVRSMQNSCRLRHPFETGGILIGHYTKKRDHAIIATATCSPMDSIRGLHSFQRGTRHLQRLLKFYRMLGKYYLGEWHCHPAGKPNPSREDRAEMLKIARTSEMSCPTPLLLIMAKTSSGGYELGAYVISSNERMIELRSASACG